MWVFSPAGWTDVCTRNDQQLAAFLNGGVHSRVCCLWWMGSASDLESSLSGERRWGRILFNDTNRHSIGLSVRICWISSILPCTQKLFRKFLSAPTAHLPLSFWACHEFSLPRQTHKNPYAEHISHHLPSFLGSNGKDSVFVFCFLNAKVEVSHSFHYKKVLPLTYISTMRWCHQKSQVQSNLFFLDRTLFKTED